MDNTYFKQRELVCKCKKPECEFPTLKVVEEKFPKIWKNLEELVEILGRIRVSTGRPVNVSSVLRCKHHDIELKKKKPGAHRVGRAADIVLPNAFKKRCWLLGHVYIMAGGVYNIQGIGRYKRRQIIHIDTGHPNVHRPADWILL